MFQPFQMGKKKKVQAGGSLDMKAINIIWPSEHGWKLIILYDSHLFKEY